MTERRSIDIEGYRHANPIPAACRIGNVLMSGVISGRDPTSGQLPPSIEEQCANMFRHVQRIVEAAGGSTANIIKLTIWLRDSGNRDALNAEWVRLFPDPASRPARHTLPLTDAGDSLVQCDVAAVFDDAR
jgi:enamine deaminase RidA (YjgF/YER057c/UK114 family)